ncbi:MAG: hypothetical protein M0R06_00095 [Sphaerochaeta sp.]|jgi:hypothetical protein|nr:hypothetical protein [Sphaerochaeta sp.]
MTDAELTTLIRRMTLSEAPGGLGSSILATAKAEAINLLAQLITSASPESFEKKVVISPTNTNVPIFAIPSDCRSVKKIWDYYGTAGTISAIADNGSGLIRVTHDMTLEDGQVITIHDVAGCTEANDTWQVDYVDATNVDLVGSTFTNAYTSGGRIFIERPETYEYPLTRRGSNFSSANDDTKFYSRKDNIIIDDPEFTNDIIVLYRYFPSALSEIPDHLHFGIYAFASIMLIGSPTSKDPNYGILQKNLTLCQGLWDTAQRLAKSYRPVLENDNISDERTIKRWI